MGIVVFILIVQIAYVSISTLRLIIMMKGNRNLASLISFAEVFIYILGLSAVLDNMDTWYNFFVYCLGFAIGVYTGALIEEKMAMGYVMVQVTTKREDSNMAQKLRDEGFGVTAWLAEGLTGDRLMLNVLTKRNRQRELLKNIQEIDPQAFVISYEPKTFVGGFWVKRVQ